MRLATIVTPSGPRLHVRGRSGYVDVAAASGDPGFAALCAVLRGGPAGLDAVRGAGRREGREWARRSSVPPSPPQPDPLPRRELQRARDRGRAGGADLARGFVRGRVSVPRPTPTSSGPPHRAFRLRGRARHRDRAAAATSRRTMPSMIAGYVVLNDASAREWQRADPVDPRQEFDGTMPIGPEVVTPDEVDLTDVELTTT